MEDTCGMRAEADIQEQAQAQAHTQGIEEVPAQGPQAVADQVGFDEPEIDENEIDGDEGFYPNIDEAEEEEDDENDEVLDARYNENEEDLQQLTADGNDQNEIFRDSVNPNHLPFDFCNNPRTILFYYFWGCIRGMGSIMQQTHLLASVLNQPFFRICIIF